MTNPAEPTVVSDTTNEAFAICIHCGKGMGESGDNECYGAKDGMHDWRNSREPVPECAQAEIPEERAHAPVAERDQKAAIPEKCVHAPEIDLSAFDGHTPGPWTTLDYHDGSVVVASGDCNICDIEHKGVTRHGDARLIAAAPTLLADLRVLRAERDQLRMERDAAWNEGRAKALMDARAIVRDYVPRGKYANEGLSIASQIDQRIESLQSIDAYLLARLIPAELTKEN